MSEREPELPISEEVSGRQEETSAYARASERLQALAEKKRPRRAEIRQVMQSIVDTWHPAVSTASWVVYSRLVDQIQELHREEIRALVSGDREKAGELRTELNKLATLRMPLERAHEVKTRALDRYTRAAEYQDMLAGRRPKQPFDRYTFPATSASVEEQVWKAAIVKYGVIAFRTNPGLFVGAARRELAAQAARPPMPPAATQGR